MPASTPPVESAWRSGRAARPYVSSTEATYARSERRPSVGSTASALGPEGHELERAARARRRRRAGSRTTPATRARSPGGRRTAAARSLPRPGARPARSATASVARGRSSPREQLADRGAGEGERRSRGRSRTRRPARGGVHGDEPGGRAAPTTPTSGVATRDAARSPPRGARARARRGAAPIARSRARSATAITFEDVDPEEVAPAARHQERAAEHVFERAERVRRRADHRRPAHAAREPLRAPGRRGAPARERREREAESPAMNRKPGAASPRPSTGASWSAVRGSCGASQASSACTSTMNSTARPRCTSSQDLLGEDAWSASRQCTRSARRRRARATCRGR